MNYALTSFKSRFDNKVNKRTDFDTWEQFEKLLYKLSTIPQKSKKTAPLISPAIYTPNTTRKNVNVVGWAGWMALDVDDHVCEGDLENELRNRFGQYYYVCYSTASSTVDKPKFRLVFPLTKHIQADQIKRAWFALVAETGSPVDPQTKDLSRMYYIPGQYAGAHNFIFTNVGDFINPEELIAKHPMAYQEKAKSFIDRLPPEMQKAVLEHRKAKMSNSDITWTGFGDCPFVNKRQVDEYRMIEGTGWYAHMYKMMVTIACNAVKQKYPITAYEVEELVREIDAMTGNWYANRPINSEANNAIEYAYRNTN